MYCELIASYTSVGMQCTARQECTGSGCAPKKKEKQDGRQIHHTVHRSSSQHTPKERCSSLAGAAHSTGAENSCSYHEKGREEVDSYGSIHVSMRSSFFHRTTTPLQPAAAVHALRSYISAQSRLLPAPRPTLLYNCERYAN